MKINYLSLAFCIALLLSAGDITAQAPLVYRGGELRLLPLCQALADPSGKLDFAQVSSSKYAPQFAPYTSLPHFLADGSETGWLRFQLHNQSPDSALVLDLFNQFDSVELYIVHASGVVHSWKEGTDTEPTKLRYSLGELMALPLLLPPGQTQTYYLRVQQQRPQNIQQKAFFKRIYAITAKTEANLLATNEEAKVFNGFYLGLVLIMAFYSFVLYFHVRDQSYLYFSLYLGVSTVATASSLDFVYNAITGMDYTYVYFTSSILGHFAFLQFTRQFLALKRVIRWADYAVLGLMGLMVAMLLVIYGFNQWPIPLMALVSLILTPFTFVISCIVWYRGYQPAKYYVLATSAYLLGSLLFLASLLQIIDSRFLLSYGTNLGRIAQIFLFSTGLFFRINQMRQEMEVEKEARRRLVEQQKEMLEREVALQTAELREKNEELLTIEEELRQNMEELDTNREMLQDTLRTVEAQKQKMTDSIRYAETIQASILPHKADFQRIFADYFILFQPKDIVSGDFYWLAEPGNGKQFLAVVDCTGHGVPGAFMSMIGNSILNEIVTQEKIRSTADILTQLDAQVKLALKQVGNLLGRNLDGMDMALCAFTRTGEGLQIEFSGARRPLWYVKKGERRAAVLPGDRKSIGGGLGGADQAHFTVQHLMLQPGDRFYLFTDGYMDQNNPNRQKFGRQLFKSLLEANGDLNLGQQHELLLAAQQEFAQGAPQRDDITMLGIEV